MRSHRVLLQADQSADDVAQDPVVTPVSVGRDRRGHGALVLQARVRDDRGFRRAFLAVVVVVVRRTVHVRKRHACALNVE